MFSFFKNKTSVFLILVIAFSISLSSFSNTFTALSGVIFNAPTTNAQSLASSSSSSSIIPINIQGVFSPSDVKDDSSTISAAGSVVSATFQANSSIGTSPYSGTITGSPTPVYNGNLPNYTNYSCSSGNYNGGISENFWYTILTNAVCNFYWSGSTNSSSSLSSTSVSNSSIENSQKNSIISSAVLNSSSYSIIPNCPVSVNDSINYYGGGHISIQNNSPYASNNLSANINLPDGVKVYSLEKNYNFYQNGNNLNISFPEVVPYGEISTFYTTNYTGKDYNSPTAINCNQIINNSSSSVIVSNSSIQKISSVLESTSSKNRGQGTRDVQCENNDRRRDCDGECQNQNIETRENRNNRQRRGRECEVVNSTQSSSELSKSNCGDEVFEIYDSCICLEPRQIFDTSAEVDHFHICKLQDETVNTSSLSKSSISSVIETTPSSTNSSNSKSTSSISILVSLIKPPFCESPNLILSSDQKLCICPKKGDLIYIEKDQNGKEESICRSSPLKELIVETANNSSSISSIKNNGNSETISSISLAKSCESPNLVVSPDSLSCICPKKGDLIWIIKNTLGVEESICSATDPRLTETSSSLVSNSSSNSSQISSSNNSTSFSSSSIQVAPLTLAGSGGGTITIGGNSSNNSSSNSVINTVTEDLKNSPTTVETLRLSGQLSAREVPNVCDDSVKINNSCPAQGTLDARQLQSNTTAAEMFSIDDPYTCGGNLKGKLMNGNTKTVKYEFFKNGSTLPTFSYDVPVNSDGTFELVIDYNVITEDTYKIVYSAKNNSGVVVSDSIEEFVTKNCSSAKALSYFASKTVRTGGQGLVSILMVVFGFLALFGAIKFAITKPRMN
jgi:hypothetical protein